MQDFNFVILYVQNATASADFYARLLGRPPVEASPGFAMFATPSGVKLGLWTRNTVEPKVATVNGGCELAFPVPDNAAVDQTHADWRERGLKVAQPPTDMEFGRTFVALDPDGHRLRVFAPAAGG
jgi:catechol 2,3-dioxygenase-like lactoylglutathione lyase family enzyme